MTRLARFLLATSLVVGIGKACAGENVDYLYRLHCSRCHGFDSEGSKLGCIPPFSGIVGHFAGTPDGRLYLVRVPGVANAALPGSETAGLLNYVLRNWGRREIAPGARNFTAEEARELRDVRVDDVAALRPTLAATLAKHGLSIEY